MVNKQKIKGTNFERRAVELLNKLIKESDWKRIPSSGSIGTILGESELCGDIKGKVYNFYKTFRVEAKAGYNHSSNKEVKQFTIKKEWLDKIKQEANNTYSMPFLICHFDGARSGVKEFIILDIEDFAEILNSYSSLKRELDLILDGDKK